MKTAESGTFPANQFGQCRKACHQYASGRRHVMMLVCFIVLSPMPLQCLWISGEPLAKGKAVTKHILVLDDGRIS